MISIGFCAQAMWQSFNHWLLVSTSLSSALEVNFPIFNQYSLLLFSTVSTSFVSLSSITSVCEVDAFFALSDLTGGASFAVILTELLALPWALLFFFCNVLTAFCLTLAAIVCIAFFSFLK